MVAVSTAGGPPRLRVQVWRKLRSLGAVYIQQSVCLLPAREPVLKELRRLVARVRADGGTARTLTVHLSDPAEYDALVAEFNAARDEEYAEVVGRTPAFLAEIETETQRGRATYAEVEESEADLDRFRTWLGKIIARDHFNAAGGEAARSAVAACEQALAAFEQAALSAEAPSGAAEAAAPSGAVDAAAPSGAVDAAGPSGAVDAAGSSGAVDAAAGQGAEHTGKGGRLRLTAGEREVQP